MDDSQQRKDNSPPMLQAQLARVVSHDLRGQVRAIKGFAKLLGADSGNDDALARIRGAAERLDVLLVDLIDWLRLDEAEGKRGPVDLGLLAEWAVMDLLAADPGREVQLDVQPEMQAIGDEHLLRQMMQRLLDAAWRRAETGSPIRITISADDDAAATRVSIRDEGTRRLAPAAEFAVLREANDADIGMTIARRIAERHGGSITQEVDANGTTVRVRLPD